MKPNSMSSSAANTSAGMMVFLPALVVRILALRLLDAHSERYIKQRYKQKGCNSVRIGKVADEHRRALAHARNGAALDLRVGRQYALGQPRDDRTRHV